MRHIWACQVFLLHINNIFFLLSLRCADRLFPTWFYHGNGLFFTSDSRFFITKKKEIPRVQGRRFLYADTDSLHLRNPPRAREAYAGDFFGSVPTAGAACGTRKHGIRRKTPIIYVAFSVLVHKHTYCSYDFFQRLFFQRVVRSSAFCIAFHKSKR